MDNMITEEDKQFIKEYYQEPKINYYNMIYFLKKQVKQKNVNLFSKGVFFFTKYNKKIKFIKPIELDFLSENDRITINPYIEYNRWYDYYVLFRIFLKKNQKKNWLTVLLIASLIVANYLIKKSKQLNNNQFMLDQTKNKYLTTALIIATPLLLYCGRQLYLKLYRKSYMLYRSHKREIKNTVQTMDNESNKSIIRMSVGEESTIESLTNKFHSMKLRLLYKLDRKNFETTQQKSNKDPFLPPFQEGIFIADLSQSHRLIFNKYMIASNHVLIITRIFEPQFYRISSESMYAIYMTLDALNGFAFYNSDKKAGASQSHKHYQVIPYSSVDLPYLNLILKCVKTQTGKSLNFKNRKVQQLKLDVFENYQYCLLKFQQFDSFSEDLMVYSQFLYNVLNYALELVNNKNLFESYNLIVGKNYLCVVLRGNEHIEKNISINSLGVLGSMLVKNEQQKQLLQSKTSEELLDQILVKKISDQQLIIQPYYQINKKKQNQFSF